MRTIWKYELEVTDCQTIRMPEGALPLSVQVRHDTIVVWAAVDDRERLEKRDFIIIGTGQCLWIDHDEARFLGTVQVGKFVWHVFHK